jgi:hypothetical protein
MIEAAIGGFEAQKQEIDAQVAQLRAMLSGQPHSAEIKTSLSPKGRKKFSTAARKRMAEAQKQRWAKIKGESASAAAKAPKTKRKLSAERRRRIVEATKQMWAAKRAAAAATSGTKKRV